jgi:pyruvate formate lyase activating enzyme
MDAAGEPAGRVFDVSRACVHDGPGLRTVVFLKGCALRCPWCQNPEGVRADPEIAIDAARCIDCGGCHEVCPVAAARTREGCRACGRCAQVCPPAARRLVGRDVTVDGLVREVRRDEDFLHASGGGVTFSGGEPLLQAPFVLATAAALRAAGLHVAVETAGHWPRALADAVAAGVDFVLFDLKHPDPARFHAATGGDAGLVAANFDRLLAGFVPIEVRVTLVPGFNDAPRDLDAIAAFLRGRRPVPVRVQAFHRMALAKEALYGRPYAAASLPPVKPAELAEAASRIAAGGVGSEPDHCNVPRPRGGSP